MTSQGEDEEDQISEAFETSEEDVGGLDILLQRLQNDATVK